MIKVNYKFLFNFSVTRTGGGLKRLVEYSKWFNNKGGAYFVIHPYCEFLIKEYPKNKYFIVIQNRMQRVFNDCSYLSVIKKEIGTPNLYYSYGIPIYMSFGKINWVHISNILPLHSKGVKLTFFDKFIRLNLLGKKFENNFQNANIVSAESHNSLNILKKFKVNEVFLSQNGSDDEIFCLENKLNLTSENIAVVVGTQKYKSLIDAYNIYKFLQKHNKFLKLTIIGNTKTIPKKILGDKDIVLTGEIKQKDVIDLLKKAKFYISTTMIENSFNAASEGFIFANESYISDIGPHRELLENELFKRVTIPNVSDKILMTQRKDIQGKNLISWDDVILKVVKKVDTFN